MFNGIDSNENTKKMVLIIGGLVALTLVAITVFFISNNASKKLDIKDYSVTEYIRVYNRLTNEKQSLYKDNDSSALYLTTGDSTKVEKTLRTPRTLELGSIMTLTGSNDLAANDITKSEPYTKYTWKSSIKDSENYLKYLEDNGYICEYTVSMHEFIEKFYRNEKTGKTKRVIITQKTISIYDVELTKYPSIEDYLD